MKRAHQLEYDLLDKTQLARHPHKSFFVYLGPKARESAVNEAYRLCQRKRVRKDRPQVMECARCKHGILISECSVQDYRLSLCRIPKSNDENMCRRLQGKFLR